MEQETAPVHGARKTRAITGEPIRPAANVTAASHVVDIGPFVRQEGRAPAWKPIPRSRREDVINRVRVQLGLPAEESRGLTRLPHRKQVGPARDFSVWMAGLLQRIRQPV